MNTMKKTFKKTLFASLSFSLLVTVFSFFTIEHLSAQNSSDLSPSSLEAFIEVMNEEIIDLRMEMNNSGVNSENNLAIFNYYIAVRDYYLTNAVDLHHAFEAQLWRFKQHDISVDLADALLDESPSPSGPTGSNTAVSGNSSPQDTAIKLKPTSQYQLLVNQLEIGEGELEGFGNLFNFIRSNK